jgi:hypothetical protein
VGGQDGEDAGDDRRAVRLLDAVRFAAVAAQLGDGGEDLRLGAAEAIARPDDHRVELAAGGEHRLGAGAVGALAAHHVLMLGDAGPAALAGGAAAVVELDVQAGAVAPLLVGADPHADGDALLRDGLGDHASS